jgi:hypothetical protein
METPAQIVFHQLPSSPAIEAEIHKHVAELERLFPRITSCRVVVEAPSRHHAHGHPFEVRLDLRLPGAQIVVDHPSAHPPEPEAPYQPVRDAFQNARRQLQDLLARRQERVTP